MNCLELLTADHNRVRGLFKRFKDAEEKDDTATMQEVVAKIVEELTIHTTIEEEIFYPAIKSETEEIKDTVDEGLEEHHVAKNLIAELGTVEVGSDEWTAKVKVLIESVEHHADEEEKEMFPPVRSNTANETLESLGERLAARKVELGAPPVEMALDLTKAELESLAKEQEIPGRSKMKKDELALTVDPRG
jgi:hemerythrin superfamily protein